MPIIQKINDNTYNIFLTVKPGSKRQKISQEDDNLIVSLKSQPTKNKANKEIINLFKKRLNIRNLNISILSGRKKKEKIVQLIFQEKTDNYNDILERLFKSKTYN